jgi:carboxymethylenebutenolidase
MTRSALFFCSLVLYSSIAHAQEYALDQLEASPRHHEWVEISSGDRTVHSFVAYPENEQNALAVIVIHENRGLTDWVRSFADQIAAAGYIAIAPDLLSDFDAEHERTSDFATSDAAREALYELNPDQVTSDLLAVQNYASEIPSANGTTVVAGFCWGGAQAFRFATNSPDLAAAMVFYGSPPENQESLRNISAPVYGFYGGDDQRINATIPATEEAMDRLDKTYEYEIYDGAGHAYMRSGDDPAGSPENKEARDESWDRLQEILSDLQ